MIWEKLWAWRTHTIPISSINTSTRQITMREPARYAVYNSLLSSSGSRYYIQGVLNLLDEAGEFYLDTSAVIYIIGPGMVQ